MTELEFKLPGSSFQEISKIIQAYAQINRAASLEDVSKRAGINSTTISANNGFLLSLGVIEGGKSKSPTSVGKRLGDALGHGLEDEARALMRHLVDQSEFLKGVIGAIRIRRGMDESALRSHIAYSAGAGKTPAVLTGAGAVVELLLRAGAIQEEDGKFVVSSVSSDSAAILENASAPSTSSTARIVDRIAALPRIDSPGISLTIEVRIDCTPADLDGLGAKLRSIVEQFNNPNDAED